MKRNLEVVREMKEGCSGVIGPYASDSVSFYGSSLSGDTCSEEIQVGLEEFSTNTASTERIHGQTVRRAAARCMSRAESAAEAAALLVAADISRCGNDASRASGGQPESRNNQKQQLKRRRVNELMSKPTKRRAVSKGKAKAKAKAICPVRRPGGGGKWRIWVSIRAHRRKLTAEFAAELAEMYRMRTDVKDKLLDDLSKSLQKTNKAQGGPGLKFALGRVGLEAIADLQPSMPVPPGQPPLALEPEVGPTVGDDAIVPAVIDSAAVEIWDVRSVVDEARQGIIMERA